MIREAKKRYVKVREAIIFLHGIVGNKNAFKAEISALKNQYHCIAYNFYNTENSREGDSFSLSSLLNQLYIQYKKHRIKKAHLCALSFGSIIATAFVEKYPDMVISLTCIGGYCCHHSSQFHSNLLQVLEEKQQLDYKVWVKRYASLLNPNKEQLCEDSEAIFVNNALLLEPLIFEKAIRLQLEFDSRAVLNQIKVPVLWIMGEYDDLYKGTLSNLKKDIPHVKYKELKNAGHVAHIHQPEQFMSIFKAFLADTLNGCLMAN